MIAGPELVIGFLLLAAGAVYLLRKMEGSPHSEPRVLRCCWPFSCGLPLDTRVQVAGRTIWLGKAVVWEGISLQIGAAPQALLTFLLITAAVVFIWPGSPIRDAQSTLRPDSGGALGSRRDGAPVDPGARRDRPGRHRVGVPDPGRQGR